jgi:thiamine-phosphate pyrophosphorylase
LPCAGEWNLIRPAGRRVATHALCHDEPMASGGQRNGEERRARLRACRLYLVVESGAGEGVTEALVGEALAGGVDIVQVRDKNASDEEVVAATRRLREPCERHGALLVVNDRPDLTLAAGADGVHVGQEDVPVAEVRRSVGPDLLIGLSTHSPAEVDRAAASEADYIGVGPIYRTATKPALAPAGLELVRYAAEQHTELPWFAIGGINEFNLDEVIRAGATRVVVVRAITEAADPVSATEMLKKRLQDI